MNDKKPRIPTDDELAALRAQIEERTAHLANNKGLQQGALLREVNAIYPTFNKNILRNLRDQQLIRPRQEGNNYHYYTVSDLRDILLLLMLKDEDGGWRLSYTESLGTLLHALRRQLQEVQTAVRSLEVPMGQSQLERGLYIWRSSLVRYFLLYLFEGKLSPGFYVFLIKPHHSAGERRDGSEPRFEVKSCQYGDVEPYIAKSDYVLATAENGDVFHSSFDSAKADQFAAWYQIEGGRTNPPSYQIIIAAPDGRQECRAPHETSIIKLLLRLIDGCFLDERDVGHNNYQGLTALDVVISLIPKMSPVWQYAACLAPDPARPDHLAIRSDSKQASAGGRQTIQIGVGQLLSGRAYKEGYPVVVQRTIDDNDPRIAEGRASGAAAVPTLYNDDVNGALYVASRTGPLPVPLFSEDNVALLRHLGLIAGQLLGQDKALAQSGRMSLAIINDPAPAGLAWDKLPTALAEALKNVNPSDAALGKDSIHLVAVQVKTYNELEAVDPDIAVWAIEQLHASAVRYFTERHIAPPQIYTYTPREFLLLVPRIPSNDEADRKMREALRERLNSLSLTLPAKGQFVKVECDLWSLPFRYAELLRADGDQDKQVSNMITAAEEAFVFLPFVYQAHQYERDGAWQMAYDQYRQASWLTPNNQYLRRHIAKALTQLQRHSEAIVQWSRIMAKQKHPSHYRRLAQNLVALGTEREVVEAINIIQEAIDLDPRDARSHATAGSIYAIAGQLDKAVDELEMAATFDPENAARYQLHIANIYFTHGRFAEALDACIVAQTHDGSDRDVSAMMMKVASARNRPAATSPLTDAAELIPPPQGMTG